jgi:hypothetical protein
LNKDAVPTAGTGVVLVDLRPEAPGLHADDGVDARVVVVAAVEHSAADDVLLQLVALAGQRSFDHVPEEPARTVGVRKTRTREDAFELGADVVWREVHRSVSYDGYDR